MKLTTFRHIAAGTSAAALVSASAFFGASTAFAQPTADPASTASETGTQNSTSKSAKPEAKTAATTPEFDLSAHEVSAEGLREGGVAVTVKNLQADDVVEVKGEHVTAEPAFAKDGMATVVVKSDSSVEELENAGSVTFTAPSPIRTTPATSSPNPSR